MVRSKPRPSTHRAKLLTSYRCFEGEAITSTGFGRTVEVGDDGALMESPDPFPVGQLLALQFLLDGDQLADARGRVTRVKAGRGLFRVRVQFEQLPAKTRRLLARQVA